MDENKDSDAELMKRVAAGNNQACRRLLDTSLSHVMGLAYKMLGDRNAAEDIAQESFLRLLRQAGKWKPDARISTWLYRVAHNLSIDELRVRGRLDSGEVPDVADETATAYQRHHQGQVSETVEEALASLPERQRTAIALVHYQEVGNIEAAEIMGIGVGALESLLSRGRRTLRENLMSRKQELLGDME